MHQKRFYLYLFLLIIAVATMIMLRKMIIEGNDKMIPARDYDEMMASGELNVVTGYNAIGYYVSGDTAEGFQHGMMQALEREWGVRVNIYLSNSLDENLEGLLTQRYDLVARSIPVNIQLRDSFAFTHPITLNKQVLVQRKAAYNDSIKPIRQHLNLAKKTIHVPAESPAILRLNNLSHEIGDTIYIVEDPTYDTEQLVMMVAAGDIDYTVCDEKVARQLVASLPEIDTGTDISFTQLESWALRRDSPQLLDSLNSWLSRFKETPEFRALYEKYY